MTERENAINTILYGKPEWVPCHWQCTYPVGSRIVHENGDVNEMGFRIGGIDDWGVAWEGDPKANAPTPAATDHHILTLDEIENWRDIVKVPEVDKMDWENGSKAELAGYDGTKLLSFFDTDGVFNRLTDLMGFEDALCALALYPDECEEIFKAIADYKIDIIRHAAEYLKPDVFCYMDDVASSQNLMMSVDCYRKLIKPQEARIFKAIADAGMIVEHHICGRFEAVADDILELGVQMLLPAQSSNNLEAIMRKKPDICFDGGTNTQAAALSDGATEEDGRAEARRCINTYGVNGHYMVHITMLGEPNTAVKAFMDEAENYGREYVRLKKANVS